MNAGNIKTLEDDLDPKQRIVTRSCTNFDKVVREFSNQLNFDLVDTADKNNSKNLFVKMEGIRPVLKFNSLKNSQIELNSNQKANILTIFEKNIDTNLKKIGLIQFYIYTEFNYIYYIFKQSDSYYSISIPTNVESEVSYDLLQISCGVVDAELLNHYQRISKNFTEKQVLELYEIDKSSYRFYVRNLNEVEFKTNDFDFSKNIPELINSSPENTK